MSTANQKHNHTLVLEVTNLHVCYGAKSAVRDVSFAINRGEIFGLLGRNGAGKTSTLSAIEGLVKPQSGTLLLDGMDMRKHPAEAKANIGVQLQSTSFHFELTINQLIKLYAGLYNVRLSNNDVLDSLKANGLDKESGKPFKQLSGGQQQRVSLLIAIIHRPSLLLLDEPTSGLDPQSRRQLWNTIGENRRSGGSILLTTHSMEEAQAVCDRVAIIDHGKLITVDTPKGLIEQHSHDPRVRNVARGTVTLEDVFIGLTGSDVRE
jgi:ABC-2 type transport system ATP-binding protein